MSLVETLVAIAILSVAVAPILYTFVYTTRFNAKAKVKQRATNAVTTVMENMKAIDLNTFYKIFEGTDPTPFLFNNPSAVYHFDSDSAPNPNDYTGVYWIEKMSFNPEITGSPLYDVKIEIENERTEKLVQTPIYNKNRDVLFEEKTGDLEKSYDPYYIADKIIEKEEIPSDTINKIHIKRIITVSADDHHVSFDYKYDYSIDVSTSVTSVTGVYGYDEEDDNTDHLKVDIDLPISLSGTSENLGNIYFFYYPAYKNKYTISEDESVIPVEYIVDIQGDYLVLENTADSTNKRNHRLFISRQRGFLSPTKTKILDNNYQLKIEGSENLESTIEVYDQLAGKDVFGNIKSISSVSEPTGANNDKILVFDKNKRIDDVSYDKTKDIKDDVSLTASVNISIYESGTYNSESDSGNTPIVAMEGTVVRFRHILNEVGDSDE